MQYLSIIYVKITFTPRGVITLKLHAFASAKLAVNDSLSQRKETVILEV